MGARATQGMAQPRTEIEGLQMSSTVGVVGCGRWGSVHLNNLLEMKRIGLIDRVVACDLTEKTTQSFLNSDARYRTWQAMCKSEKLDLIVLATPNNTHYPLGMAFLAENIKTLIEKPFAPTFEEAADLIQQAKANDTVVFCGHLLRHHPGVIRMAQILLEDQIGNPTSILYRRTSLREKPQSMNLLDGLASHGVDLLAYFFPQRFDFSVPSNFQPSTIKAESTLLEFSTNPSRTEPHVTGWIEVGWGAAQERREIHIKGDKGTTSLDFGQHEQLQLNGINVQLESSSNPLLAQILASLTCDKMTSKQESAILSTVVNMEQVKTCTTRQS